MGQESVSMVAIETKASTRSFGSNFHYCVHEQYE